MAKWIWFFVVTFLKVEVLLAQSSGLEVYWDDGLKLQSKDSMYRFSLGGRVHYDIAFSRHSPGLDTTGRGGSKVEVRRARLSFEGLINNALAYEFEFTFGERIEYADMYFAFLRLPFLERLTVGHFREPFGMEELTSSNATVFMERSLTSAFGPSRNTGIMVQKHFLQKKLRGYAGIFRITDDLGADLQGKGNHSFSTRWAMTPFSKANNEVLHLGLSYNRFTPDDSVHTIETNNEVNTNPEYISTGAVKAVRTVNQIGGETGYTKGPFCVQAEWIQSYAKQFDQTVLNKGLQRYKSFYIMASYFLKGGTRSYSNNGNRFSSIKVTPSEKKGTLRGAWEAALRFSQIDVSDAGKSLHTLNNITTGLNWYINSNSRVMANYVHSFFNGGWRANTLQFRVQVTF